MVSFNDLFTLAFGKYNTPGVPSSDKKNPKKVEIWPIGAALDAKFVDLNLRIDAAISGTQPKLDVDVALFANVNLSTGLVAGMTVNGVLLVAGMRVSPLGQTNGATQTVTNGPYAGRTNSPDNGVRIVQGAPGLAPRATDMDSGAELLGAQFFVRGGTVGKGATWKLTATGTITPDVTGQLYALADERDTSIPGAYDALLGVGASIPTGASVDLNSATGNQFHFTGGVTIGSVTLSAGRQRYAIADADFTITVSDTLIGDNDGLPVFVRAGTRLLFVADNAGVVRFNRLPAAQTVQAPTGEKVVLFTTHDDIAQGGFSALRAKRGGFVLSGGDSSMLSIEERPKDKVVRWALGVDEFGQPGVWGDHKGGIHSLSGSLYPGGAGGIGAFDAGEIAAYDSWAMAQSALTKANGYAGLQRFLAGVAHVALYGQSLSVDALGHWLRRAAQLYDALMLGNSIHSSNAASSLFNPFGGSAVLNNYTPTVLNAAGNALIATSGDVAAAGGWMSALYGSDSATGFADMAKFLWLQRQSMASDATRKFVLTNTGRGGKTVAELAQGTTFYNRTVNAANKIKTANAAAYIIAMIWTQGEANTSDGTTFQQYYDSARLLFDNFDTDVTTGQYAQARKPIKLIHQTSAKWVVDSTEMAVQMAQLALAQDFPDIALVGPTYPYSNKTEGDGHLDANGYLWKGSQEGKVFDRIVFGGEGWQPLKAIKVVHRANEILLMYNVPAPPIEFRDVLAGYALTSYAKRGYKVTDLGAGGAEIGIVGTPEIVGQATVRLKLASVPAGTPRPWYASQSTAGNGNLFDSDLTPSLFNFTYQPGDADDASANVAAMVGKPFPLFNAACVQLADAIAA